MKPRDLFLSGLRAHLAPLLTELGFRFQRSKLNFERDGRNGVRHQIHFQLSRWNVEDHCEFWSAWGASAPSYAQWYRGEWGEDAASDALAGLSDWNIPGWSRRPEEHFVLRNRSTDVGEWGSFRENVERAGLPFLERVSSWEGAAEQLRSERWHFDLAADFLLLAGERDRAREALLEGIQIFERDGRADNFRELPRLQARLARYFPPSSGAA